MTKPVASLLQSRSCLRNGIAVALSSSALLAVLPAPALAAGSEPGTIHSTATSEWVHFAVFGTLGLAILVMLIRWRTLTANDANVGIRSSLGPADWSFDQSWATNLAGVAALLGTILAAGALPDTPKLVDAPYAGLNVLFGILVIVAPLCYVAFRVEKRVHKKSAVHEPQLQGYVGAFLVAATITLWAALGELVTIFLFFRDLRTTHAIPDGTERLMWIIPPVIAFFVVAYVYRTSGAIVRDQSNTARLRALLANELSAKGIEIESSELEPAKPSVPVL